MKITKHIFYLFFLAFLSCSSEETIELLDPTYPTDPTEYPILAEVPFFFSFSLISTIGTYSGEYVFNCHIEENIIIAEIPSILSETFFIPEFRFNGEYVKVNGDTIKSNEKVIDFSFPQEFTIYNKDGKDSTTYKVKIIFPSDIPVMYIKTHKSITTKEEYIEGYMRLDDSSQENYHGGFQIRLRGNGTLLQNKKPYHIKLDKKTSLLGMPSQKNWVLLANYRDKTLLRNSIAFELSRLIQMPWTPKSHFIEVYLNGKYEGIYLLTEHVRVDENRVDIQENGYLFEKDNYYDEESYYFKSALGYYFTFKHPKPATEENTRSVYDKLNEFENELSKNKNCNPLYKDYIDFTSWAKWYIINNFLVNRDPNYFYFTDTAKKVIYMGPVWDFEWVIGYTIWENELLIPPSRDITPNYPYFTSLLKDEIFNGEVKKQWEITKREHLPQLKKYIDHMKIYLERPAKNNFNRWDISSIPINTQYNTWEEEMDFVSKYIEEREEWFDKIITNF